MDIWLFHCLAMKNNAALNIPAHVHPFLEYSLWSRIARS